ncbi:MAG: histidine phosphatase family protein [Paracoccaceae bacterium]
MTKEIKPKEVRQLKFNPWPGAADLLLIRHGESQPAIEGVPFPMKDGHGDPALHPNGRKQAIAVGERLKTWPIAAIYVTTLQRTHQTAAPLARHLGLTPKVEPDLREVCLGQWDAGLYRLKAAEGDPIFRRSIDNQEWGEIPGAETTAELQARVRNGLLRIASSHPDQLVAVVVHGGVIAAAMSLATGAAPFAFLQAENGSISRLVIDRDKMKVRGYNDVSHLD